MNKETNKRQNYKLLEDNTGGILCDLGIGKSFPNKKWNMIYYINWLLVVKPTLHSMSVSPLDDINSFDLYCIFC